MGSLGGVFADIVYKRKKLPVPSKCAGGTCEICSPEDILEWESAGDPRISPDGKGVVYTAIAGE